MKQTTNTFQTSFSQLLDVIEQALKQELPDQNHSRVAAAMRYSALARGKRLRPMLLLASAGTIDPSWWHSERMRHLLPAAVAVECIHVYSLIHDDLPCMDDDDLRRGQPTCHKVFGEATALLAGDALLTYAFELLGRPQEKLDPQRQLAAIHEIASAIGWRGMVMGQSLDLEAEQRTITLEELRVIHRGKTGALFRACVLSGALLAGAEQESLNSLSRFAEHFGVAFQIIDDILDVTGDSSVTGKDIGRDEKRGKATYVSLIGLDHAWEQAMKESQAAIASLEEFGPNADFLRELTRSMLFRQS